MATKKKRRARDPKFEDPVAEAVCVGCGCSDMNACPLGCSWLRLDAKRRRGVCSSCPKEVKRWDQRKRDLSDRALASILDSL